MLALLFMEIKVLSLVLGYFVVRIGVLGKVTAIPILRKRLNAVKDIYLKHALTRS